MFRSASHVFVSGAVDADNDIVAPGGLEHRDLAEDQAQSEEHLRDETVVVVTLGPIADRADRAEAEAAQCRALQRDGP